MIARASSTRSGSARLLPTALPWASRNVFAIPPPMTMTSTLASRFLRTLILSLTLAPPMIAANGRPGLSSEHARGSRSPSPSGTRRTPGRSFAMPDGRGVRAVRGPERVVDVDVRVRRRAPRRTPGRSAPPRRGSGGSRAAAPRRRGAGRSRPRVPTPSASPVTGTVLPISWPRRWPDGPEPEAVGDLAVGPAEVAREDHPGALRLEVADRRQRRADAGVVGDLAVLQRDVEVDPHEDALARRRPGPGR